MNPLSETGSMAESSQCKAASPFSSAFSSIAPEQRIRLALQTFNQCFEIKHGATDQQRNFSFCGDIGHFTQASSRNPQNNQMDRKYQSNDVMPPPALIKVCTTNIHSAINHARSTLIIAGIFCTSSMARSCRWRRPHQQNC